MSADIAWNLWSLVCSCLNSYCTFFICSHFWFFKKICCFLHWIQSVNPHFYVTLYYNRSLYIYDQMSLRIFCLRDRLYIILYYEFFFSQYKMQSTKMVTKNQHVLFCLRLFWEPRNRALPRVYVLDPDALLHQGGGGMVMLGIDWDIRQYNQARPLHLHTHTHARTHARTRARAHAHFPTPPHFLFYMYVGGYYRQSFW